MKQKIKASGWRKAATADGVFTLNKKRCLCFSWCWCWWLSAFREENCLISL